MWLWQFFLISLLKLLAQTPSNFNYFIASIAKCWKRWLPWTDFKLWWITGPLLMSMTTRDKYFSHVNNLLVIMYYLLEVLLSIWFVDCPTLCPCLCQFFYFSLGWLFDWRLLDFHLCLCSSSHHLIGTPSPRWKLSFQSSWKCWTVGCIKYIMSHDCICGCPRWHIILKRDTLCSTLSHIFNGETVVSSIVSFNRTVVPHEISKVNFRVNFFCPYVRRDLIN